MSGEIKDSITEELLAARPGGAVHAKDSEFKESYQPSYYLRWNTMQVNPNGPTATIPWTGEPQYNRFLQQLWISDKPGERPQWRNVGEFWDGPEYD